MKLRFRPSADFVGLSILLLLSPAAGKCFGQTSIPAGSLPTVDEILDRSVIATGGREQWLKLTSMHIRSDLAMSQPEMTGTLEIYSQAPNKQSACLKMQGGLFFCQVYDGKSGWGDSSAEGLKDLEGKELDDIKREADFYSELDRKKQYRDMKVTAERDFDGLKVYVIEGVRSDGQRQELYFAKDTGLQAGSKDLPDDAPKAKTSYYKNYELVAGPAVKIPTKLKVVSHEMTMQLVVTAIESNVQIHPSAFEKPARSARDSANSDNPGSPENGKVTDNTYHNSFFSFAYSFPQGWAVHGEETNKALQEAGSEMLSGDDEAKKARLRAAQKRSYHLLTAFEFPLGTPGKENSGVQIVAENVAFAPGIKTGADYLWNLREVLKNSAVDVTYDGEPGEITPSGTSFFRQNMVNKIGAVQVYESVYATVSKGYGLAFIFTARSRTKLEEITQSMNSFQSIGNAISKP